MKILVYNIAYSTGLQGSLAGYLTNFWRYALWAPRSNFKKLTAFLKDQNADILCLLEADTGSFRNRFRSQVSAMAERLSFPFFWSASKYGPQSVSRLLPTIRKQHDAILSRFPGEARAHYLNQGAKKLVHEFELRGISLFVVHLALRRSLRERQIKELSAFLLRCPRPYVLCGDFNIFQGIGEIRELLEKNHLKLLHQEPTFPSVQPRSVIDLVLVSEGIRVKGVGVVRAPFSDHLPVWVELEH